MGGLSLAAVLVTPRASAEAAPDIGSREAAPPPFSCTAASILAMSGALPRNVPAVPMAPSSLLMAATFTSTSSELLRRSRPPCAPTTGTA